ncbi:MAG: excinuclease ABC subunit UvrA [Chloroflexi bacterium]|nr:excinuclease ABC subunit UvrA [Chloroflexota bacterium]
MPQSFITVKGAREHNLKNIDVQIPRDRLVVITGVSGSGKSSLAFDTIYAEGQRRYVESLSAYARQFLGRMEKPDVDLIEGLSPAISIDQKGVSKNPRSTVGTVTEIYDYLRLLFARAGRPHCPNCGRPVARQTIQQIVDSVLRLPEDSRIMVLAPVITHMKGEHLGVFGEARKGGFVRVRVDGEVRELEEEIKLAKTKWHNIEIIVDRLIIRPDVDSQRLTDSIETALRYGKGTVVVSVVGGEDVVYSEKFACVNCGISISELEPRNFSFNTPYGACPTCTGLGFRLEVDPDVVIPDKSYALAEGAIAPYMRAGIPTPWVGAVIQAVADRFAFSTSAPVRELSREDLDKVLYGTNGERVQVRFHTKGGKTYTWWMAFEGVIPNLERRHKETESENVREDIERFMTQRPCATCEGFRLKPESLAVTVLGMNIIEVTRQSVERCLQWVVACRSGTWPDGPRTKEPLNEREQKIATQILKEIDSRLGFLAQVGLDYLTVDRAAATLSGGEGQRIRLATQIGSGLMGVLYVCDEPSVGLHPVDDHRLITTLKRLRDIGNTVLIVEHDEAIMRAADHIVDLGPGAGELGGRVVVEGPIEAIMASEESITGAYLSGRRRIPIRSDRRAGNGKHITIHRARANNLKGITIKIPLGMLVCVTGVSGSGKSSLINEVLFKRLAQVFYRAKDRPGEHDRITGIDEIDKVVDIDQSPIGRTPRSNPATYTNVFAPIRDLFASLPEAKARGYTPGRFSFNVKGGRCEACEGAGYVEIAMQFLPDVTVPCEVCRGARYNREALEVKFKEASISDVLNMTVDEAHELFVNIPAIRNKLETLRAVGLGYIRLGQPATTLSGGEAQRVKLATELSRRATGRTLYILDEPTTGLSFEDCAALLRVMHKLTDAGNTVVLIEHHLDLIKNADWIIDLGPDAGERGGRLVAEGTPEFIAAVDDSYTGQYLRKVHGIRPDRDAPGEIGSKDVSANGRAERSQARPRRPARPEATPAERAVKTNGRDEVPPEVLAEAEEDVSEFEGVRERPE